MGGVGGGACAWKCCWHLGWDLLKHCRFRVPDLCPLHMNRNTRYVTNVNMAHAISICPWAEGGYHPGVEPPKVQHAYITEEESGPGQIKVIPRWHQGEKQSQISQHRTFSTKQAASEKELKDRPTHRKGQKYYMIRKGNRRRNSSVGEKQKREISIGSGSGDA